MGRPKGSKNKSKVAPVEVKVEVKVEPPKPVEVETPKVELPRAKPIEEKPIFPVDPKIQKLIDAHSRKFQADLKKAMEGLTGKEPDFISLVFERLPWPEGVPKINW